MALLVYSSEGQMHNIDLPLEKSIPTCLSVQGDQEWLVISDDYDHQEHLIQVIRADNGFYVVIPTGELAVQVNEVRIFGLHTLRNTDSIQAGSRELRFYEWVCQEVTPYSRLLNSSCPFCSVPFNIGDKVMLCPKCDTPLHDYCWETRKGLN